MTKGTIVAFEPSVVPATNLVIGITAINKIKNGIERNTFTTKPNNLFSHSIG